MRASNLVTGSFDQRLERFGAGRVAADHVALARLLDPGELIAAAAGGAGSGQPGPGGV